MELTYVDVDAARRARGIRLVTVAHVPSPWSEAAKGTFHLDRVPFVGVRLEPRDPAVREWTRHDNAPVALYDDEPARTGWAAILELAERLSPSPCLVPDDPRSRVPMLGLCHEVLGEGGLAWNNRLRMVHTGLATGGERGFHPKVAAFLGARYGYRPDRMNHVEARFEQQLALLLEALGSRDYFFGDAPTALDVQVASATNMLALLPDHVCPTSAPIRKAFETMGEPRTGRLAPLVAHRDRMYERHLGLPIVT